MNFHIKNYVSKSSGVLNVMYAFLFLSLNHVFLDREANYFFKNKDR